MRESVVGVMTCFRRSDIQIMLGHRGYKIVSADFIMLLVLFVPLLICSVRIPAPLFPATAVVMLVVIVVRVRAGVAEVSGPLAVRSSVSPPTPFVSIQKSVFRLGALLSALGVGARMLLGFRRSVGRI